MRHFLIVNSSKKFAHSNGQLNDLLTAVATDFLRDAGFEVKVTPIDQGYNIDEEVQKILWADVLIYQMPAWWMGPPWILKKYFDEVLTAGHGSLYSSDGRTRSDSAKKYGSGGLCQGKRYMLSTTWNAPLEAFDDPKQFFGGVGVDGVYLPVHKTNQFLGMASLPSFVCNDVVKTPDIDGYVERYRRHLDSLFVQN